jgi:hypothetical protein
MLVTTSALFQWLCYLCYLLFNCMDTAQHFSFSAFVPYHNFCFEECPLPSALCSLISAFQRVSFSALSRSPDFCFLLCQFLLFAVVL